MFSLIRVLLSSVFTVACSLGINIYYTKKPYKTFSGRVDSKFYFYNFFCLMNNLVAEFYGIMSAGIQNMDSQDNDKILDKYSSYIFIAALKVSFSLVISPYLVRLSDYVWKWVNKIKFSIRKKDWPINYNKVISDIPIEHNFDFMATFMVQVIFFMGFFQPFMIPALSLLFILGLIIFYKVETHALKKWESHRRGFHVNKVKLIYTTSFLGYLVIQGFSFGNMKIVLGYFKSAGNESFSKLLTSFLDYTTLFICILIAFYFIWSFRYKSIIAKTRDALIQMIMNQEKGNELENQEKTSEEI